MMSFSRAVPRLVLLVLMLHAVAGFYSKGSDVVPITNAAGVKRLQRSNYLWVLEFYREGCGYCVQAAPEYEKAATSMKRMVGFAAVDVEKNQAIAGQLMQAFGVEVKGVPTIVILKPKQNGQGMAKIDYPGERTAAAFTSSAKQHMPNYTVKLNQKTWEAFDGDTDIARAVVFSDKAEPTAMIKGLSAKFRNRLKIAVVSKSEKAIAKALNVTSYPALRVLAAGSSSSSAEAVHFKGKPAASSDQPQASKAKDTAKDTAKDAQNKAKAEKASDGKSAGKGESKAKDKQANAANDAKSSRGKGAGQQRAQEPEPPVYGGSAKKDSRGRREAEL